MMPLTDTALLTHTAARHRPPTPAERALERAQRSARRRLARRIWRALVRSVARGPAARHARS